MCLVAWSVGQSERFPWLLASNRDEFFNRPAAALAWWRPATGAPAILSGRDLSAGGAWLGLTADGRLALVTNVREPGRFDAGTPSRGDLVPHWLRDADAGAAPDPARLDAIARVPRNGYNLLLADLGADSGHWLSNRPDPRQQALGAGHYGLSNAGLDTPWPKVLRLKRRLAEMLAAADARMADAGTTPAAASDAPAQALADAAFAALADTGVAPDAELPATGVPLERERQLSPAFIRIDAPDTTLSPAAGVYGTRCSTVVIVERIGARRQVRVIERRYSADGGIEGETAIGFDFDPVRA